MQTKLYGCVFFILSISLSFAQKTLHQNFKKLSCPEKWWVISHPFIAKKTYVLTQKAIDVSKEIKKDTALDGDENGGQVDAFRHAYWMALLTQNIKPHKALRLGIAHEKGNKLNFNKSITEEETLPDSVSCVMDMENNKTGIELGKTNISMNQEELKQFIKKQILLGQMKIISKDNSGNFLDCSGNKIIMETFKGKWNIPKCLKPSN